MVNNLDQVFGNKNLPCMTALSQNTLGSSRALFGIFLAYQRPTVMAWKIIACYAAFEAALQLLLLGKMLADNEETGVVTYEVESPDKGAFLVADREFGFEFCKRTQSSVFIREIYHSSGQPTQSKRKRMSVIVWDEDGQIILFCKGADSIIFDRLSKNGRMYEEVTTRHLNEYGEAGLRTLALAYRKLDKSNWGVFLMLGWFGLEVGFMGGGEDCIEADGVGRGAMADSLLQLIFCYCFMGSFMLLLQVFLGSCVVATAILLAM
ncbi:hypothetical protein Patl1_18247 [Pistacia atlantica]|uniref:Uncharacterized protein n=1 Tax=Pistacia atlantica TaxID=434234 RepID=A0ACC1BZU8_9ROSI|nr:hypothetical protein Patl1_18247 [Pistacia atlantica]